MSKNTDGVHRNRGNKTKLNVVLEWSVLSLNMQEVIFVFKVNQYCLMLRYIVCETVVDSRKVINLCQRLFFFVSRIDIGPEVSSSQPYHNQKPCCFLIVKYHSHSGLERVKVSMIHNSPQKAGPDFWWMWSQKNHVGCIKHSMECQTKISCYVYSIRWWLWFCQWVQKSLKSIGLRILHSSSY